MEVKEIPLSNIIISDLNVRKNLEAGLEDSTLDDLAKSIKENGLLYPIIVFQQQDTYELVVGQRRYLACKKIGLDTIPAIVKDEITNINGITLSLIENLHRADMHPIDKARALNSLYENYGSYQKVSKESGLSTPTIKRYLALLKLSPSIQDKITTSSGPAGVGTLSKLAEIFPSGEDQELVLESLSGFNQQVQLEILKLSKGKLENLERFREMALDGAFDVHVCHGIDQCNFIPDELKNEVKKRIIHIDKSIQ